MVCFSANAWHGLRVKGYGIDDMGRGQGIGIKYLAVTIGDCKEWARFLVDARCVTPFQFS